MLAQYVDYLRFYRHITGAGRCRRHTHTSRQRSVKSAVVDPFVSEFVDSLHVLRKFGRQFLVRRRRRRSFNSSNSPSSARRVNQHLRCRRHCLFDRVRDLVGRLVHVTKLCASSMIARGPTEPAERSRRTIARTGTEQITTAEASNGFRLPRLIAHCLRRFAGAMTSSFRRPSAHFCERSSPATVT
jgi:hypothetical protein